MDPNELLPAALTAYEGGRRRTAAVRLVCLWIACAAVIGLQLASGPLRWGPVLTSALLASMVVWGASVRGGDAWRGARRGLAAGLLPLAAAWSSSGFGTVCTPAGCASMCVPACVCSGVIAAAWIARRGVAERRSSGYWGSAALAVVGVGGLGCVCAGAAGALALAASAGASLGTAAWWTARLRRA